MPRAKPQPSTELRYLRLVMSQDWEKDDKEDVELGRYRALIQEDAKWIAQQKRSAEKEYRDELAAWKKEAEQEAREEREGKVGAGEYKMEPVDDLICKLLDEWDEAKAIWQNG
jgi:hypothetical protein